MGLQNHIFIDNAHLLQNANEQVTSFITLGKNYMHYTITIKDKSEILFAKTLYNTTGSIAQSEFDTLLSDTLLRNSHEVHVAIDTPKQTLVPTALLNSDHKEIYFTNLHEIEKDEEIMMQYVSPEIIELYLVKKPTIVYLKNEFKKIALYSHSACLISTYMQLISDVKSANALMLHTSHDTFYCTYFNKGQLQFYQSFDLTSASDVLYCVLNILQWQRAEIRDLQLFLTGFSHKQNEIAQLLNDYINVETFTDDTLRKKITDTTHFPVHILFNQYSLMSCVL